MRVTVRLSRPGDPHPRFEGDLLLYDPRDGAYEAGAALAQRDVEDMTTLRWLIARHTGLVCYFGFKPDQPSEPNQPGA